MRDIFLLSAVLILMVPALRRPQVGLLAWLWISIMNPHKLSYGFIYSLPILDGIAAVTLLSCLFNWKERASSEFDGILKLLLIFYFWCTLTTVFSVNFALSLTDWVEFSKTLILVLLLLLFMNKKHWILACVGVFILSIGFVGFKGGVFTILTGGESRVWGAHGSAWGDNNGVSVAMLMVTPITLALVTLFTQKWKKIGVIGLSFSFFAALLGTQSRGGLVGLLGVAGFAVMRSQRKVIYLIAILLTLGIGYSFMPDSWHERMSTIQNHEEDKSASTRLIQWKYAIDISLERPFFGNGFDAFFYKPYYYAYVAHKDENRSVHSNYFQVLGEQGYIGLFMYLLLMTMMIYKAKKYALACKNRQDLSWAASLLFAIQFSIIGYAANGLTVNMAYLDLYYYLLALGVLLISYIKRELALQPEGPNTQDYVKNKV